jgi:membrane-associated phospholipid phosphatase
VARSALSPVDRRARHALATAAASALGLAVVGVGALAINAGHALDASILHGFTGLHGAAIDSEIRTAARLVDPVPYAFMGLVCVAVALGRGRTSAAVATAIVLVGTGSSAQALKHLLGEQERYTGWLVADPTQTWWPSGHATAAMTLALCAVMVAPPTWRPATALLACGCALTVAYATLALTWHFPSDVIGGFLLAGLWVSAALVVLASIDAPSARAARPPALGLVVALGAAGALAAAALVGAASGRVALDAVDRVSAVAGALAIAAIALALLVLTAVGASEDEP